MGGPVDQRGKGGLLRGSPAFLEGHLPRAIQNLGFLILRGDDRLVLHPITPGHQEEGGMLVHVQGGGDARVRGGKEQRGYAAVLGIPDFHRAGFGDAEGQPGGDRFSAEIAHPEDIGIVQGTVHIGKSGDRGYEIRSDSFGLQCAGQVG